MRGAGPSNTTGIGKKVNRRPPSRLACRSAGRIRFDHRKEPVHQPIQNRIHAGFDRRCGRRSEFGPRQATPLHRGQETEACYRASSSKTLPVAPYVVVTLPHDLAPDGWVEVQCVFAHILTRTPRRHRSVRSQMLNGKLPAQSKADAIAACVRKLCVFLIGSAYFGIANAAW